MPRQTPAQFFRKYFCAGHNRRNKVLPLQPSPLQLFVIKHQTIIAIVTPIVFVQIFYWLVTSRRELYTLFNTHYEMTIVMAIATVLAGATAEGGGADAFPVMTLLFHVPTRAARDFAVMIQTVGLNCAAVSNYLMDITIELHTVIFASIGGCAGTVISLEVLDYRVAGVMKKLSFVSLYFSFACALFLLNHDRKRKTFDAVPNFGAMKALLLTVIGFFGGLISGLAGAGLDGFVFAIITLLFRVNEKVAAPTSVCIAGLNSAFVFFWRHVMLNAIPPLAWEYFTVCIPAVCCCAPVGALLSARVHRRIIVIFVYLLESIALLTAFIVLRPSLPLSLASFTIIITSLVICFGLSRVGRHVYDKNVEQSMDMEEMKALGKVEEA